MRGLKAARERHPSAGRPELLLREARSWVEWAQEAVDSPDEITKELFSLVFYSIDALIADQKTEV
jgi:hypothetical protein